MKLKIQIEDGDQNKERQVEVAGTDTLRSVLDGLGPDEGWEPEDFTEGLEVDGELTALETTVSMVGSRTITIRRVWIELHFETEVAKRKFPASARWRRVHVWGCRKFSVGTEACANLEPRDSAADGPPLNETGRIGYHRGCRSVWLIKPGPEPNGNE